MKIKTFNKILVIVLALTLTTCTIASARTIKNQTKCSVLYRAHIDPPGEGGGRLD